MNERIERGYCDPLAPVATYRARLPQQSATSAIQELLVHALRAICIKVFEWWSAIQTTSKKKVGMDGQSTIRLICSHIIRVNLLYQ